VLFDACFVCVDDCGGVAGAALCVRQFDHCREDEIGMVGQTQGMSNLGSVHARHTNALGHPD
jgi:hypothetical protein